MTNYSGLRKIFWPIEWHENKKFLPMAAMMFFILYNYSMLRSIKDGFIVSNIGAEALGFLKTYFVLPSAVLCIIGYAKLCNIMSQRNVFYTIISIFAGYLALFTFVLYPNQELIHTGHDAIESLATAYPNFKWFIRIGGKWSFATFYVVAELWSSVVISLLFWQFANQITKTDEAKRFYALFGLIGNLGLPCTGITLSYFLKTDRGFEHKFMPILIISVICCVLVMVIYKWINNNVLTDPRLYDPSGGKKSPKKKKPKLSIVESFKLIFSSKYLGLIAILVLAYGISINLVEGVWKSKIRELYPSQDEYTIFMGNFQMFQGVAAIIFMIIGSNILRKVSWKASAILTPVMILVTGLIFFGFIFFDDVVNLHLTGLLMSPLAIAVAAGTIQNVLSKASKYSLFDATKEMAYIPLDDELKTKGKAAVDVVGGRLGKSGGGVIQSTFFMLLPTFTFYEATPYFGAVFFAIVLIWIFAVQKLSVEYKKQLDAQEEEGDK